MTTTYGGDLVARALKEQGVRYIFTLCGGHLNPIYNACIDHGIGIIDVRHEQAAAHAAAGWARATGEPGVAVVTAGPGVTDAVTGVVEAMTAGCPMIVFGGRSPLKDFERGALQDMDQVRLMDPITKWAKTVFEARRIPEYISAAFRIARSGTPGPVYVECPVDVLQQKVDEADAVFLAGDRTEPDSGGNPVRISQAVDLLMRSERPVIVAGNGVFWSRADRELREFVELTEVPVQTADFARGAVPDAHPLTLPQGGTSMADFVLALGVKFDFLLGYGNSPVFDAKAKVVQVDIDAANIGFNRGVDVAVVGGPKTVLRQMIDEVKKRNGKVDRSGWLKDLKGFGEMMAMQHPQTYYSDAKPVHPGRLAKEVAEFIDASCMVVIDGGDGSGGWFAPFFKAQYMGQVMGTGPFGCLGVGTGFALAAKLAHPDRKVLCYFGDGTFGLNGMEFDTYVRHNLPIVGVISNDSAWGMVRHWQKMDYGEDRCQGMGLKERQRYDRMVEALGGYGEYVTEAAEIKPALGRAFASGLPACINVEVDPQPVSMITTFLHESMK